MNYVNVETRFSKMILRLFNWERTDFNNNVDLEFDKMCATL